jgi:O-acetylhomoserine/O-acetylserine sulfhydrylase-like pyridoxal-dependent enzyme
VRRAEPRRRRNARLHAAYTSHAALSREQRHAAGIGDGFIRLALGIEDAADLIADLDQALARLGGH